MIGRKLIEKYDLSKPTIHRILKRNGIKCQRHKKTSGSKIQAEISACNAHRNKKRREHIENGLCVNCKELALENVLRCLKCTLKALAGNLWNDRGKWQDLLALYEAQNRRCPYSGRENIFGLNTTLDHKIPRSKSGTNDISNLQFIVAGLNSCKGILSEQEFIALINDTYHHLQKAVVVDSSIADIAY